MDVFLLFVGDNYYPSGGWADFKGAYSTVGEALAGRFEFTANSTYDWWHIVRFTPLQGLGEIVEQGRYNP